MSAIKRIYVEKKEGFDIEAKNLLEDVKQNLGINKLENLRILNRYDIEGISAEEYKKVKNTIFSEPNVDDVYDEVFPIGDEEKAFGIEYLPGQYDQRADSAEQCVQIFTQKEKPHINTAKIILVKADMTQDELKKIKEYCINPVDSREAELNKPDSLKMQTQNPENVEVIHDFLEKSEKDLMDFKNHMGFAMSFEDLLFCQKYFKEEKRNPTITELKVIDTYWSDHCRHTTFMTEIEKVQIEEPFIQKVYDEYLSSRKYVYEDKDRDMNLMDLATIGMKELRKKGKLDDLDVSDEINACSINIKVDVEGTEEDWLLMFKNETHNHPTEIEPFGGAATCLGGAIRDPLSGRSYVYQAMRLTGSADPRLDIKDTLDGKLPQRKITTQAAAGYSSYGNQIGLATGAVAEVYDEDFVAKRMEVGAVIAAAPKENVVRENPALGDVIILVGGRTGRDGVGGATGSSKEHDEESILNCGAEVQKGNAPTERKIQRLFRNPIVSKMIKRCNDFGAGGVSVAIGELTDSLEIDLDQVPKKYDGLDGTEIAISESQERMAVVVKKEDAKKFINLSNEENLEATVVAKVTDTGRLVMKWKGKIILDISREFLDTNGVKQKTLVSVQSLDKENNYFTNNIEEKDLEKAWIKNLKDLNIASQKGLIERFDSTIGAGTVLMPLGGKYQLTPAEGMAAKIPVMHKDTTTGSLMSYGYNPKIGKWSPFHGALYAVVEAISRIVAMGGDYKKVRLSFQEYFEKLDKDPKKWGKPFSALLGAYLAQKEFETPAIGGKDSMSGTFKDITVPPTLAAFAVSTVDIRNVISPEIKKIGSKLIYIPAKRNENELIDFEELKRNFEKIHELVQSKKILSIQSIRIGGIASAISKMAFGNKIGVVFEKEMNENELFAPNYGSFILEMDSENISSLKGINYEVLGTTQQNENILINHIQVSLEKIVKEWEEPLESVFPTYKKEEGEIKDISFEKGICKKASIKLAKPRIFIPAFPGTNCEYDTQRVFEEAGGVAETLVFKNLTPKDIEESIEYMVNHIKNSQIIALPGGFSAGDEPDGSGKFIATIFRNEKVKNAVMDLLKNRDGLMIGICNGFQALIKLGLLPYGEIKETSCDAPTLTFNNIGRHVSTIVRTKVVSNLSPWMSYTKVGEIHTVAVSHGEGRFVANEVEMKKMVQNGQIATQYVDMNGNATHKMPYNPNGSFYGVEGITSPDGRIFGKMGHTERMKEYTAINIDGNKDQSIFKAGVDYFK
ncbi:phosphoribosylformylglycinamidine synthase [Inediibacterium massiliense]|uniref:phosphoribosylformylglycinamidine synthase n=1 Tax=Inediibacterium massiliense TaxID=1658111 RepID=UPI0006B4AA65|nr:phosphoribosylformylglycinamidine synthase [Inediibacterium massiliense]